MISSDQVDVFIVVEIEVEDETGSDCSSNSLIGR